MSALSGCKSGAMATGMIDPSKPHDAYTEVTTAMNSHLTNHVAIDREDAKRSVMTTCYGSKKVPKELFGEDTPELAAFYKGLIEIAPGTWEVLQDLLNSWQPYALSHDIKLPDGFDAHIKVMEKQEVRIEVDELDHASFTYVYYDNIGTKKGISLPANVVHSVDGFIVREMHRRCNYDVKQVQNACAAIKKELAQRTIQQTSTTKGKGDINTYYYYDQYCRSNMISIAVLPYIKDTNLGHMDSIYLTNLLQILCVMLHDKPFEIVTVHDSFASHANNVNWVRWNYKEILAEIADSNLLDDILTQLNGMPCKFNKISTDLGDLIRKSNYSLS